MREFLNYVKSGGRRGVESNEAYEYYAQVARQVGCSGSKTSFWRASSELTKLNLIHSGKDGLETRYYHGAPDQAQATSRREEREAPRPSMGKEAVAVSGGRGARIPGESIYCPKCGRKVA